jgi:hypothetical protein
VICDCISDGKKTQVSFVLLTADKAGRYISLFRGLIGCWGDILISTTAASSILGLGRYSYLYGFRSKHEQ